ncbi:MAG: hypothetical protein EBZ40_12310 [Gammaproteobacteria bacterium]|nr:hypothetical protein [Gammaproteobacteria bacterium]
MRNASTDARFISPISIAHTSSPIFLFFFFFFSFFRFFVFRFSFKKWYQFFFTLSPSLALTKRRSKRRSRSTRPWLARGPRSTRAR